MGNLSLLQRADGGTRTPGKEGITLKNKRNKQAKHGAWTLIKSIMGTWQYRFVLVKGDGNFVVKGEGCSLLTLNISRSYV